MSRQGQASPGDGDEVAAVIVLRRDGAVLMQHRDDIPGLSDAGKWVMPGGHREPPESLETSARRELLEETGYRCGELKQLAVFKRHDDDGWPSCQLTVFWTWYDGVQPVHCLEGQALKFILREEAHSYGIRPILIEVWDKAIAQAKKLK